MTVLFLKAQIKGGAHGDLFAMPVQVQGYTRGNTYVAPHTAHRDKKIEEAPHQVVSAMVHAHPAAEPTAIEPDHLASGRRIYDGYKALKDRRSARGLEGVGTASDDRSFKLWEARLNADPMRYREGWGVSYEVASGRRHKQINRGFRIMEIDHEGKRALIRSVSDTGLTSTGGEHDRISDDWHYLGDLKRDKKYDRPVPVVVSANIPARP